MDCGMKMIKWLLFVFNLIFFICGFGLIITGGVIHFKFKDYVGFFDQDVSGPAILLIVVGVIIFFIGFFGCWGAVKENRCMILTFAALLIIIFVMEISGGIAAYVYHSQIKNFMRSQMTDAMNNYDAPAHEGVTKAWNKLQSTFDCCGVNNYTDWTEKNFSIPDSCCVAGQTNCTQYFNQGCLDSLENNVFGSVEVIGGVGIGFALLQMIGIIFACCLAREIHTYTKV